MRTYFKAKLTSSVPTDSYKYNHSRTQTSTHNKQINTRTHTHKHTILHVIYYE